MKNIPIPPPPPTPTAAIERRYGSDVLAKAESMAKRGYGVADIYAEIGISKNTHDAWRVKHPEYENFFAHLHKPLIDKFYEEMDDRRRRTRNINNKSTYTPAHAEEIYTLEDFSWSEAEMASKFNISKSTLQLWVDKYEDFREAMEWYVTKAEAYWMKLGGEYAFKPSKASQPRLYTFQMANRFGMIDSINLKHSADGDNPIIKPKVIINAVSPKESPAES